MAKKFDDPNVTNVSQVGEITPEVGPEVIIPDAPAGGDSEPETETVHGLKQYENISHYPYASLCISYYWLCTQKEEKEQSRLCGL